MKRKLPIQSNDGRDVVDRREWTRYRSDLQKVVVLGQASRVASIVDESFGGIGIVIRDVRGLSVNQPIQLLYSDAPMTGIIRRIQPAPGGAFYVGVQWANASK